jgi:hypothetical protein
VNSTIKKKYLQNARELKKHLESHKYRGMEPHKGFIKWYCDARFGKAALSSLFLCDRKNDGGIDAIIEHKGTHYVIQSKYEVIPKINKLAEADYHDFTDVARYFRGKKDSDGRDFNGWLEDRVRKSITDRYRDIKRIAARSPRRVRFILITTKEFNKKTNKYCEVEDIQYISALWHLYSEGFSPPTESIKLTLHNKWRTVSDEGKYETWVGLVDVRDFFRLMKDDQNERLFAQNVRTDKRSAINREIKITYRNAKERKSFWLGNNGIYIVCKNIKNAGGNSHCKELVFPSIINGSQTLHTMYSADNHPSCNILVRILKMDCIGNPLLLRNVIRRTNTQNPMKLMNLSAHDRCQLNIARFFDTFKLFYERREAEWRNEKQNIMPDYIMVPLKEVTQWLSVLHSNIGLGTARSQVSKLFQDKDYKDIFDKYQNDDFDKKDYLDLCRITWSGLIVKSIIKKIPSSYKARTKMSHLLLIKLIYKALIKKQGLQSIILDKLELHQWGRTKKAIPKTIMNEMKVIINKFQKIQATEKRKKGQSNIDFSNFFKRDDLTKKAFDQVCKPRINALSEMLAEHCDAIH